jgi:CRP/FNR family cyclic AMP-dependent transcriptional regulator
VPDASVWRKSLVFDDPHRAAQHAILDHDGGTVTLSHERTIELLAGTRLFANVDAEGLRRIADRITEVDVPSDRVIARQGEIGTGFFLIASGAVRVVRDGEMLADLGPGEFFGELSVLDGKPRNAQVVSTEPTICLALASWDFEAVVREQPSVAIAILRELAGRLRDLTETHRH